MVIVMMWFRNTKHEHENMPQKGIGSQFGSGLLNVFMHFVLVFALNTEIKYSYMHRSEPLFVLD